MKKWAFLINLATALINASTLTVLIILYLLQGTLLFVLVTIVLTAIIEALAIIGIVLHTREEGFRR